MRKKTDNISPEEFKKNFEITKTTMKADEEKSLLNNLIESYNTRLRNYRELNDHEPDIQFINNELKRIEEYLSGSLEKNDTIYKECIIRSNRMYMAFSDFKSNYQNFLTQLASVHKTAKSGEINVNEFTGYWTQIIQALLAYKNHIKKEQLSFIRSEKKIDYKDLGVKTINTKLLLLEELGIIDLLKNKLDIHISTNVFADLIAMILNEDSESVLRAIGYFSSIQKKNKKDKNNPNTKRNFLIIKAVFEKLELTDEVNRIDKVIRNKYQ